MHYTDRGCRGGRDRCFCRKQRRGLGRHRLCCWSRRGRLRRGLGGCLGWCLCGKQCQWPPVISLLFHPHCRQPTPSSPPSSTSTPNKRTIFLHVIYVDADEEEHDPAAAVALLLMMLMAPLFFLLTASPSSKKSFTFSALRPSRVIPKVKNPQAYLSLHRQRLSAKVQGQDGAEGTEEVHLKNLDSPIKERLNKTRV